jgi:DNA-binding NarL/FixJ family response regulator
MVEDRPQIRVSVRQIIERELDWHWVWEAESLHAARLNAARVIDVLLLDLGLPDGTGLDLVAEFSRVCHVIVFSVLGDEESVTRALELGAAGYLLKDSPALEITQAIRSVMDGGAPLTPSVAAHLLRKFRKQEAAVATPATAGTHSALSALTPRERDVLLALARGFSYDEAATILGISRHTVGHHVKQIYSKLAVNSRSQAVFEAVQAGWLQPDHE